MASRRSDAADAEVDGILGQRRQRARRRFFQSVLEDDDRGVLEGIEAGAPLNQVNTDGETPLLVAAKRGFARIVRILLDAGAHIDTRKAPLFATALYWAVARGHTDIALLLIERGADVRVASKFVLFKPTALHLAAFNGHDAVVRELLKAGADKQARDSKGKTAADWARRCGHLAMAEVLGEAAVRV